MRDTMIPRGPDGAKTWVATDGQVGLGHRRLAIIDLSETAAQPMCNEDGTLWIVFNGEIYNHAEIRAELAQRGRHRWKTDHSDTEVILHAFEQWGIACLHKFRGMFAIALWDAKARELWLIRDRIGVKPLYYSLHHGRLTFASEIKALLQDPEQQRAVDEEAFYHYLSFLTTPAPHTLFAGIHKLPPGTWLRARHDGHIQTCRYWDVWDYARPLHGIDEDDIAQLLLAELRRAVALRKVSDVPVGVFLSGGIDSSTNAALFAEGERDPIKTFTIGYKGNYPSCRNELHYARQMAEAVGATYHERLLDVDDCVDFLPHMVYLQDEPIADPVCVPLYYLSQLAREHGVTVCQVGEGSDELFWGYPMWKRCLTLQQVSDRVPVAWPKQLAVALLKAHSKVHDTLHLEWLRRASLRQPLFWGGAEAFTELEKKRLLHPRLRHMFRDFSSYEALRPIQQRFKDNAWEQSPLHWMSYLDLNLRLPELLLMRVDKMSMAVGLEARVPFLDHVFVELAMSIPAALKTRHGTLKYLLKKAVRGVIADAFIDRPKQGFDVPVYEWLAGKFGDQASKELLQFCRLTEFLDHAAVERLLRQGKGRQIWYLLNFALWWKTFIAV